MYHHQVTGLASIQSISQYQYNDHVEAWLRSRIKVVGPNYYPGDFYCGVALSYKASIDNKVSYGDTPKEAANELMGQLGF